MNGQGWAQKRTEIEATVQKYLLDIAGVTETRSHRRDWTWGEAVDTWESGHGRSGG